MSSAGYPIAFAWRAAVLALVWWALTGGSAYALWLGALAVVMVAALSLATLPPGGRWWRPLALARFAAWFALQSLRGALDVAGRALHPRLPLHPVFIDYPLTLRGELPRVLFINTLSLMPGTLSAQVEADRLRLHVLAPQPGLEAELRALERRVGAIFGAAPAAGGAP